LAIEPPDRPQLRNGVTTPAGRLDPFARRETLWWTLEIACKRCGRCGRYNVERLVAVHGRDAKLTEFLVTLANCEKARSFSVYDRCQARFEH
jgi:hypothetical protein